MRCRYLLTNVKFNDTYKDSCYFPTIAARDAALIGGNQFSQDDINFNYGTILSTSCVVNEYNQENYVVLKRSETDEKYFYFIDSVEYLSSNQWRLYLKMDVINQYMVGDTYKNIAPCLVERAHVNRWATNGNRINFNVSNDSEIIVPEFNFEYITEKRNKVKIHYCNNTRVNDWLNNNVACWRIFYIDTKHMFKFYQYGSKSLDESHKSSQYDNNFAKSYMNVDGNSVNDEYVTFCEPVYRHGASEIYFSNVNWGLRGRWSGCDNFRNHNEGNFIYNVKYVYTCPLDIEQLLGESPLYSNKLILSVPDKDVISYEVGENVQVRGFRFSGNIKFLFTDGMQNPNDDTFVYFKGVIGGFGSTDKRLENVKVDVQFEFTKSEVVGAKRQNRFEPKRLLDCKRITLRDSANGEYSYRLLYCATNSIPLKYTEMNNITNNNYYFRVAATGIIPVVDETNWHGVVNTTDYSQQIVNDAYESFIANNKNFHTIRGIGYITSLTQSAVNGSLAGVGNTLLNFGLDELKLDNIKNAPNSLRNTNDTFLMNFNVNSGLNLYVDFESCREVEENKYINYLYSYGYKINKIDWITRYINTRKYFNYLKCNIDSINMEIPNQCEMEIKRIFSQGVRLWNDYKEMYNYEMENYEKMLEN